MGGSWGRPLRSATFLAASWARCSGRGRSTGEIPGARWEAGDCHLPLLACLVGTLAALRLLDFQPLGGVDEEKQAFTEVDASVLGATSAEGSQGGPIFEIGDDAMDDAIDDDEDEDL